MLLNINQNSIIYENEQEVVVYQHIYHQYYQINIILFTFEFNKERVDKLKDLFSLLN